MYTRRKIPYGTGLEYGAARHENEQVVSGWRDISVPDPEFFHAVIGLVTAELFSFFCVEPMRCDIESADRFSLRGVERKKGGNKI
jgi:hypothetical protein